MAGNNITELKQILGDYCPTVLPFLLDIKPNENETLKNAYCILLEGKYRDDCNYQDLTGFEVIYKLRQELRFMGSIIVLSFLERDNIKKINYKEKQRYPERILDTSNIEFYHINGATRNREEIQSNIKLFLKEKYQLSQLGLDDVINYSTDYGYVLDDIMHTFRNNVVYKEKTLNQSIEELKSKVLPIIKAEFKNNITNYLDKCKIHTDGNFLHLYDKIKGTLKSKLLSNDFSKVEDIQESMKVTREWSVLYIDDDTEACDKIKELFYVNFNLSCLTVSSIDELVKNYNSQTLDEILWVISDYRLKEGEKWFPLQGFDLLNKYFDPGLGRTCSIFTSKTDQIKRSSSADSFDIKWHDKYSILDDELHFYKIAKSYIIDIDTKYKKYGKLSYPNTWNADVEKNQNLNFKQFYKKLQSLNPDWTNFNFQINRGIEHLFYKNDIENTLREYKKLSFKIETNLTSKNYSKISIERIKIRRIVLGFYLFYGKKLCAELGKTKTQVTNINKLFGISHENVFVNENLVSAQLHKDDIDFLDKIDSFR